MLLDVALAPALLRRPEETVSIVVDVLRASSACVTIFDRGASEVAVAATADAARALRGEAMPHALLCGEVGGLPPEGFDFGNSPVEFATLDLSGRQLVMATSNGTRALHAVASSPAAFVGCLLNRAAVAETAIEASSQGGAGICIVCAGNDYGSTFSLDDAFAAGAIVDWLDRRFGVEGSGEPPVLTDSARMARRLFHSYAGDAFAAFREGSHGRTLDRLGFVADLEYCGRLDRSDSVPSLSRRAPAGKRGAERDREPDKDEMLVLRAGRRRQAALG